MKTSLWLALVLALASGVARAGSLVITSPAEDAVVNGTVSFTASVSGLPSVAGVEWLLNGRSISGCLETPPDFARPWHPAEAYAGAMTLQAVGRDAEGRQVAASPVVHFTAALGAGSMRLDEPGDLSKPLAGTVTIGATAIRPLTPEERKARENDPKFDKSQMEKTVEALQFFVDGVLLTRQFGAPTRSFELDTTRLPNGVHELMISSYAWMQGIPPIGMIQTTFTTDNGHAPMAILPRWSTVCLQPGETADLAPLLAFTDGRTEPLKIQPAYESTAPAVATVDARGKLLAAGKGVATIKLNLPAGKILTTAGPNDKPFTAQVRVVVGLPDGLPHFSRNGRLLMQYDPRQSCFVRSMFSLNPKYVLDTPGLADLVKDAGVNTCETGFFYNPNDGSHIDTLDKYVQGWDPSFDANIAAPAQKLGVGVICSGDDWVRTTNELKWTASTPWALGLATHIWTKLRDSNCITAIEMMDEASFLGDGPAPTDGHWAKNDPAIHDDALVNLIGAIKSVANHTPISWPVLGLAGSETAGRWMGDPRYADYASQYWTTMDWRMAYPWAESGPQMKSDLDRVMIGRFGNIQWDRPQLMLVSGCGPFYTKRAEDDHFQPGLDEGAPAAAPAAQYSAQPLYAALIGAAGVRMYSVDFGWKPGRARAAIGAGGLQTGASPQTKHATSDIRCCARFAHRNIFADYLRGMDCVVTMPRFQSFRT